MNQKRCILLAALCALVTPKAATGQAFDPIEPSAFSDELFFYRDLPYGSDAVTGPLDVLLNKGFAFGLAANRSGKIFDYTYGWEHVSASVRNPIGQITGDGGWGKFFRQQILPINLFKWVGNGFKWDEAGELGWYPNYTGHLVEGGITHRRLMEWYLTKGVPRTQAIIFAGMTTMASAVINEAYTHPESYQQDGSAATVADLFFFDPLGIVLFSFDGPSRFFAQSLGATVWPGQPALTTSGELVNTGNQIIFKLDILPGDNTELFIRTGVGGYVGITLNRPDGWDVSIAAGVDAEEQMESQRTGLETVSTAWGGGIYIDRYGSLVGTLALSQAEERAVALNVYPGVITPGFGFFTTVARDGRVTLGLSTRWSLGLGFAAGFGG